MSIDWNREHSVNCATERALRRALEACRWRDQSRPEMKCLICGESDMRVLDASCACHEMYVHAECAVNAFGGRFWRCAQCQGKMRRGGECELLLAQARLRSKPADAQTRFVSTMQIAFVLHEHSEQDEAIRLFRFATDLADRCLSTVDVVHSRIVLAWALEQRHDALKAIKLCRETLAAVEQLEDPNCKKDEYGRRLELRLLFALVFGTALNELGKHDEAERVISRGMSLYQPEMSDDFRRELARARADALYSTGDVEAARRLLLQSIDEFGLQHPKCHKFVRMLERCQSCSLPNSRFVEDGQEWRQAHHSLEQYDDHRILRRSWSV